jgi:hypothetical protein
MKYIVINLDGNEMIFVFPSSINHDRMFEGITTIRVGSDKDWHRIRNAEVVSAGFVDKQGNCFGESMTLDKKSRGKADTDLLGMIHG